MCVCVCVSSRGYLIQPSWPRPSSAARHHFKHAYVPACVHERTQRRCFHLHTYSETLRGGGGDWGGWLELLSDQSHPQIHEPAHVWDWDCMMSSFAFSLAGENRCFTVPENGHFMLLMAVLVFAPFLISFFFFGKISFIMFQLQGLTLQFDRDNPPPPNLLRGGNPAKHARPFVISA